jgi:hypothetical protein
MTNADGDMHMDAAEVCSEKEAASVLAHEAPAGKRPEALETEHGVQRGASTLQSIFSPHENTSIKVPYTCQAAAVDLHGAHIVNECSEELQSALEELDPNVVKAVLADIGDFREMKTVLERDEYSISTFMEVGVPFQSPSPPSSSMEMQEGIQGGTPGMPETAGVLEGTGHGTSEQDTFTGYCMARASSSLVSCEEAFQEPSSQHPVLNPDVFRRENSMQIWTAEPVRSLPRGLNYASETEDWK